PRVDLCPARRELDPEGPPRPARDRRAEERPADAGEWIEHQLTGLREELDEPGHQPRRLVRAVGLAQGMPELRGICRRPDRFGEVQPLLAAQLVQRVSRVAGHGYSVSGDSSPGRTGPSAIVVSCMWRTGENHTTTIERTAPPTPSQNAARSPIVSPTTPPRTTPTSVIRVVKVKNDAFTRPMTLLSTLVWTSDVSTIS